MELGKGYPKGDGPSLIGIQDRNYIETPSGCVYLTSLRLILIAKLQRLVPELIEDPLHSTPAAKSGRILARFVNRLDGGGVYANSYDEDAAGQVCQIQRAIDEQKIGMSDTEEEETEDESMQ